MSKGNVLVTGASGQVGWHLCRYLAGQGYRVTGTYNSHQPELEGVEVVGCNLEDPQNLSDLCRRDYRAVVHAAALTHADRCEKMPDLARRVNVEGTKALAGLFRPQTRFIYISTDLVFDGEKGGYGESETINPVNFYGQSKAEGEQAALGRPGGVVVRLCLAYGPATPFSAGFSSVMKGLLEAGQPVRLFVDQYRTPIYVGDIVRALERLIEQEPRHRTYHLGGAERLSRWDFGCRFVDVFGYERALLQPVKADSVGLVPRGKDCSLDCTRLVTEFGFQPSGVLDGLRRMKQGVY
ncbi:MAG: SDR family oxidoreductase [Acidobacteria bacterium]|nr:MAG: SDR family oxidoreductase [Acidobacteriota bacterium]